MTTAKYFFAAVIFVTVTSAIVPAHAGGFKIPDQSTRAMGMIDAFVGGADDASAIYYNPAGLTNLSAPEFIGNLYLAHAITYYDGIEGSEPSDGRYYAVPSFYFATPVKGLEDWYLGLGVYSPYGLGSKWGDGSALRYDSTLSEIQLVNINPTIAWAPTDRLSIGGGIDYFDSRVKMRQKIMNPLGGRDGERDFEVDGNGWGYNFGLQYDLMETVTLGLTYRSQVNIQYEGEMDLERMPVPGGPPPGIMLMNIGSDVDTEIEYPPVISGGLMWQATPKLRLEFAAEWQQWSTRERQDFTLAGNPPVIPAGTSSQPIDWEDSWLLMIGGEYDLNDKWVLRAGYGYNETPVPRDTAEPSLPTGDTHAVSVGAGYKYSENVTFDVAGIVSYSEERSITDPDLHPVFGKGSDYSGDYEAVSFFLSLGVRYQF